MRIGILYGGRSGEHDVSLCSAASVFSALDRKKYDVTAIGIDRDGRWYVQEKPEIIFDKDFGRKLALKKKGFWLVNHFEQNHKLYLYNLRNRKKTVVVDVVFPAVHGTFCEDGTLQGILELAMVPYVGADVLGSAVGMDKDIAKRLLKEADIPVVPSVTVNKQNWKKNSKNIMKDALAKLGLPLFVKPVCSGSSVGVKKVKKKESLASAMNFAFQFDTRAMIEQAIDCREIECAVLGNEKPVGSILGEIIPKHEFYSYEAKYIDPNGAALNIPAQINKALSDKIRKAAIEGYMALGCSSMARVDFFWIKKPINFILTKSIHCPASPASACIPSSGKQRV